MTTPCSELIESVNDAAKHLNTLTLTFLATCAYLGITASAITDKQLLLDTGINLPLLQTVVPLTGFYALAPALLVLFHLYLLLEQYFLTMKVKQIPSGVDTNLFASSPLVTMRLGDHHEPAVRLFLRLVFLVISSALPISVLLLIQWSFLPYHNPKISTWHQFLVLADLGVVLYFFLRAFARRTQSTTPWYWKGLLALLFLFIVVLLSSFLLLPPGNGYEYRTRKPFAGSFARYLSLADQTLVRQEPPAEILSAYMSTNQPTDSAWSQYAEGINVSGRDLRRADFSKAVLVKADFGGADLTGVNFSDADLRGARFHSSHRPTLLEGANLQSARLTNADLRRANLRFANLEDAHLEGADLTEADLTGARLDRAVLLGAELPRSDLDRASLRDADLTAANLADSSLVGTDFARAKLYGADFSRARPKRARFMEAKLQGTDFHDADIFGADFRYAWLEGARGLYLFAVDLRGAFLAGFNLCGEPGVHLPELTDFRDVDLVSPALTDWSAIQTAAEQSLTEGTRRETVSRRLNHPLYPICLGDAVTYKPAAILGRKVLFHATQRQGILEKWPEPDITEREFQEALSRKLVEKACSDGDLLEVLFAETDGTYTPADPVLSVQLAQRLRDRDEATCPSLRRISRARREHLTEIASKNPLQIEPTVETGVSAGSPPP